MSQAVACHYCKTLYYNLTVLQQYPCGHIYCEKCCLSPEGYKYDCPYCNQSTPPILQNNAITSQPPVINNPVLPQYVLPTQGPLIQNPLPQNPPPPPPPPENPENPTHKKDKPSKSVKIDPFDKVNEVKDQISFLDYVSAQANLRFNELQTNINTLKSEITENANALIQELQRCVNILTENLDSVLKSKQLYMQTLNKDLQKESEKRQMIIDTLSRELVSGEVSKSTRKDLISSSYPKFKLNFEKYSYRCNKAKIVNKFKERFWKIGL